MTKEKSKQDKSGELVDLASFRKKKTTDEELARGRKPLYVSHKDGKMSGSPHFKSPEGADFGDRLGRIRSSLDKINRLMAELKRMSSGEQVAPTEGPAQKQK